LLVYKSHFPLKPVILLTDKTIHYRHTIRLPSHQTLNTCWFPVGINLTEEPSLTTPFQPSHIPVQITITIRPMAIDSWCKGPPQESVSCLHDPK